MALEFTETTIDEVPSRVFNFPFETSPALQALLDAEAAELKPAEASVSEKVSPVKGVQLVGKYTKVVFKAKALEGSPLLGYMDADRAAELLTYGSDLKDKTRVYTQMKDSSIGPEKAQKNVVEAISKLNNWSYEKARAFCIESGIIAE